MKNIITAIGKKYINEELAKEKNVKVIGKDLLYKDAVFEIIEKNKIDYLIISENIFLFQKIFGDIKKIKKLEEQIKIIYLINNNNQKINKLLKEKNINIILINKKTDENYLVKKIKEIIQNKKYKKNNYLEINFNDKNRKGDINKIKKNLFCFILKKIKFKENKKIKDKNIIIIIGENKIGKSTVTVNLAKACQREFKSKILIIDFNIINQNIYSYLKNKKYSKKIYIKIKRNNYNKNNFKKYYLKNSKKIINDFMIKGENHIDYISGLNLIFEDTKFLNQNEKNKIIKDIFFTALENYKVIFIDTSSNDKLKLNSILFKNCTKILLVTEANLLGTKQVWKEVENFKNKKNMTKDKLKIIINNYDGESFNMGVLKKCLKDFLIIGKIKKVKNENKKNIYNKNKYKKILKRIF